MMDVKMVVGRILFVLLVLIVPGGAKAYYNAKADSVRFFGNAPSYAGITLVFERTANFISRETQEVVRLPIDKNGNFDQIFALAEITYCFADIGVYRGYIYCEPGCAYELEFPVYTPRPLSEKFNPYFMPELVEIGIKNPTSASLSVLIRDFDSQFDSLYGANAVAVFSKADVAKANAVVAQLDSIFPRTSIPYFEKHRQSRYGRLLGLAYKRQRRTTIAYAESIFIDNPNQPAYSSLFNDVFKDFFQYYFATPQGKRLRESFGGATSFDSLSLVLAEDTLFSNHKFREVVLLKALYDAYYSERYNKDQIEKLFLSAQTTSATPIGSSFAQSMHKQVTKLKKGTEAPDFVAYSASGRAFTLASFKGKFVYLSFANTQNHACKKDLIAMGALARDFKKDLEVVAILTDENSEDAFAFEKKNGLKYNFLHFNNNGKVLLDYSIKALPTYFLIDPEGNIISSSALPPGESFVKFFQETVRNFKFNKARKAPDSPRSIYDL
jgi:peroxiredoxin